MRKLVAAALMSSLGIATPVLAGGNDQKPQVTERDAEGRATKVMIEGKEYLLCTSDNSDGCINPREAGFSWGNHTAKTWPGRPISREN